MHSATAKRLIRNQEFVMITGEHFGNKTQMIWAKVVDGKKVGGEWEFDVVHTDGGKQHLLQHQIHHHC